MAIVYEQIALSYIFKIRQGRTEEKPAIWPQVNIYNAGVTAIATAWSPGSKKTFALVLS